MEGHIDRLGPDYSTWNAEAHACLLNFLMHACDISNGVKGFMLAAEWAARISKGECQAVVMVKNSFHQHSVLMQLIKCMRRSGQ
jgi:hypothetical protein